MTQSGYTNAIVNAMLGWLKALANWVLKLFNLSGGGSPLKFLADNWLQLLILLLIVGVVLDLLVWLVRWRPHWVWFRKKRVVINDKNFFASERYLDDGDDWDVIMDGPAPARRPRRDWEESDFVVHSDVSRKRREAQRQAQKRDGQKSEAAPAKRVQRDVFQDDLFNVNAKHKFSDKYEDEVFNVANLPRPERRTQNDGRRPRKAGNASARK